MKELHFKTCSHSFYLKPCRTTSEFLMLYSIQGEQFSMIVVVPTGNTTVDAVLERISRIPIEKLYNHMITEDEEYPGAIVEVFLPRVVINSDFVLNKALEKVRNIDVLTHIMFLNTIFVLRYNYLIMQRTCLYICCINLLSDIFFTQFRVECEECICPNITWEFLSRFIIWQTWVLQKVEHVPYRFSWKFYNCEGGYCMQGYITFRPIMVYLMLWG